MSEWQIYLLTRWDLINKWFDHLQCGYHVPFTFLPLLSQGGLPLSEIHAVFIKATKGKRHHILSFLCLKKKSWVLNGRGYIYVFFR